MTTTVPLNTHEYRKDALRSEKMLFESLGEFAETIQYSDTVIDVEGVHLIHAVICGPKDAPPLVLLHGYGGSKITYIHMIEKLAKDYRVYCVDLPGMGTSSRPEFTLTDPEEIISYFVETLEAWRSKQNLTRFTLAGHSFGGYVSGWYAKKYKQYLNGLILISPVGIKKIIELPTGPEPPTDPLSKRHWAIRYILFPIVKFVWRNRITPSSILSKLGRVGGWLIQKSVSRRFRKLNDEQRDHFAQTINAMFNMPPGSAAALYNLFEGPPIVAVKPLEDVIKNELNDIPVIFYYGSRDWMESEGAKRILAQTKGPVKLVVISDAGHQILLENPEGLVEDMQSFLKEQVHRVPGNWKAAFLGTVNEMKREEVMDLTKSSINFNTETLLSAGAN